ncbi:putative dehydrogenase [Friedmanniella endophytica]|uniref:Putative dehydrogenase n=1 Tax=Microlunatus kandeliicorticis TaxID=1759536 RepID=A0A7W3IT83_9ACTN|nr:Gfo/Idh/MocA family oxidoreductase [Microlunatus kandeliicorticis]MBA8794740.1 putative dehydrogenase [Microlunatus kandeliicorticis]
MSEPTPSSEPRRIRWGVLSTGHIAGVFARDLALLPEEAELTAVASRGLDKAEAFAAEHGFARAYGSYAELADDDEVDVVYIASPHSDHLASARLCLEAGRAVLVEKSLTASVAEAEELIGLARERGLFCMEAVWMRTNPLIRRVAQALRDGEIGALRHIEAGFGFAFDGPDEHRLLNPELAGGALLDLGVYPVHLANLVAGEPTAIHGTGHLASTGVDAHAVAAMTFAGQPPVTGALTCTLETTLPTSAVVYGTEGRIEIDNFIKPDEVRIYRGNDRETSPEVLITQLPGGGYTLQAQEVMRCLRAGELESPLVPWEDSLACMRTLETWRAAVDAAATRALGGGGSSNEE